MKKIFPIIIGLISLSLIGIIIIQLLWLKNMVALRREQVIDKIEDAVKMAGNVMIERTTNYLTFNEKNKKAKPYLDIFKPSSISQRFTAADINEIISKSLKTYGLEDVKFEFGLATINSNTQSYFERKSQNFEESYDPTNMKNKIVSYALTPPSGSETESIALNEALIVLVPNYEKIVYQSIRFPIASAIAFTLIIIAAFYLTVRTMLRQKKISEIKNDFINNMTHEFKTPLATISLAVDALKNEKVVNDKQKMNYFSTIIKEENQRMNRQVETILKAALLDKQEVQLLLRPTHVHAIIRDVVENFALQFEEKNGKAELFLNAENDYIDADEVHFSNLINNLIDNAIKYGKEDQPPYIKVTSESTARKIILVFEDNGIGMNKETVKRVFEKFYRAHTGNLHNVKGFGLGLSYVKTMVEAHGGDIKVDSVLGKGSTFTIELPLKKMQPQAVVSAVPA